MNATSIRARKTSPAVLQWSALVCAALIALAACGKDKNVKKEPPPIPVSVGEAIQKDAPLFIEGIGNVAAYNTVDVKCRVTGELIKKFFQAGDVVTKGQQLFTIDPAPYEAKVKEGEARLQQSQVQYEQAKREFLRFKALLGEKAVSQEQLETKEVDMNSKLYQVELNRAELETARLNLGYCFIESPLDGRSGEIYIDNFNIINANQDKLVTIKQTQPIKVKFSLPGKYLEQIEKYSAGGPLEVEAVLSDSEPPETGKLSMVDNVINLKTGMIGLEATFANPASRLWPGRFLQVRLKLAVTRGATLVPHQAVNEGPEGQYVWLVNEDQSVSLRPIKTSRRDGTMAVVDEGLKPGEKVVTDGQLMLRQGARIITREQMEKMKQTAPPAQPGRKDRSETDEGRLYAS